MQATSPFSTHFLRVPTSTPIADPYVEEVEALRSLDPFGYEAGDPNLYRYVGNSPTNATDPLGLKEGRLLSILSPPPDLYDPNEYVRRYYPLQARNPKTNKVAIITNNTCENDHFDWIPSHQQHRNVGSYADLRKELKRYGDGTIDILYISGHRGGQCTVNTRSGENLGGFQMPDDIYELIREKLSAQGEVIIASCHAGGFDPFARETANRFRVPVTVTRGWTRGNREGHEGGGSSSEEWKTFRPGELPAVVIAGVMVEIGMPAPWGGTEPAKKK